MKKIAKYIGKFAASSSVFYGRFYPFPSSSPSAPVNHDAPGFVPLKREKETQKVRQFMGGKGGRS